MTAELTALDPEALKYFLLHSGVFIAALGVVFFLLGFWCGRKTPPRQAPTPVTSGVTTLPAPAPPPAPPAEEKPAETAAPAAIEVPAPPPPPEPEPPQHIPIPWLEQPSAPQPAPEPVPEPAPPPPPESASPPSIPAPPEPEPPQHVPIPWLEQPPAPQPAPPPPPEGASPPPFPMTRAPAAPAPEPPALPQNGLPQNGVLKAIARSQGVILPPVDAFSFLLLDDAPPPPPRRARPAPAALLFEPEDGDSGSDDLTRIRGITHELEAKLRSLGIRRWRQIATLTAAQVREVSRRLAFKDRIEREGWQAQARALTAAAPGAAPPPRAGRDA